MPEQCGDGMCWQASLCEVIDDLKAENTQLREALQRIEDQAMGRLDEFVAPSEIARAALAVTLRTEGGS